jgi:hypothetical protein
MLEKSVKPEEGEGAKATQEARVSGPGGQESPAYPTFFCHAGFFDRLRGATGEGLGSPVLCRLIPLSSPQTPDAELQTLPGDFFGFFGALKKGDFFGVHPKKVRRASASCSLRKKRTLSKLRLELNLCQVDEDPVESLRPAVPIRKGTFLGCAPKKSFLPELWQTDLRDLNRLW